MSFLNFKFIKRVAENNGFVKIFYINCAKKMMLDVLKSLLCSNSEFNTR